MVRREVMHLQQHSSHDNVVKLLGTCLAPDGLTTTHIVMELCQGSLKDLCCPTLQRTLGEKDIVLIIWQILSGIESLHQNRVMHR